MTEAQEKTLAVDAAFDATLNRLEDKRRAEEAARVRAAQEPAEPACRRARAAVATLEAFERDHGARRRQCHERLEAPGTGALLSSGPRRELLDQTKRQLAEFFAALGDVASPHGLRKTLAEIAGLRLQDIEPGSIVPNRIDRLTLMAHGADGLPEKFKNFELTYEEVVKTLNRLEAEGAPSPVLDRTPPPRVDSDATPPAQPRHAKSRLTHGEDS